MLPDLYSCLACPVCHGALSTLVPGGADGEINCRTCGASHSVRGGIPILLLPDHDVASVHDELDHAHAHKHEQAAYFDREVAEEFEITRPYEAPIAYRWTLEEKFRRAVANLADLRGSVVVDACCGSGMDAEMLHRAGAKVIAVDISEGCARRARERARRRGLDYLVVVGDVERLPVRTRAADYAFVHDGLHHLVDPLAGVRELARVARRAVTINEPAEALATQIAVRLGLAINYEGAGNRVARLRQEAVVDALARLGFRAHAERYLMYYKHEPGNVMRALSNPGAGAAYRAGSRVANAVFGRWGNKLQVTGLRDAA